MAERAITIFACEAQPIVLEGLRRVLESHPEFQLIGTAPTPAEALAVLPDLAPDLILVGDEPGSPPPAHYTAELRRATPGSHLVLWTASPVEAELHLGLGFSGVLDKRREVSSLVECLRAVAQGADWVGAWDQTPEAAEPRSPPRLTRREREIVQLVAEGRKNREIAEALSISSGTVKVHLMHIFEKAGVVDRLQLALLARRLLKPEHAAEPVADLEPSGPLSR